MTGTAVLTQRHPRLVAGLWFGAFVGLTQLIVGLAFQWTLRRLGVSGWPPAVALPNGCLIVVAACVGAWLGPTLLTRDVSGAEGARRGAWIGIVTGIVAALLAGVLARLIPGAKPEMPIGWPAVGLLVLVLFGGARVLPIGALAGWCLVRVSRFARRSEHGRKAT